MNRLSVIFSYLIITFFMIQYVSSRDGIFQSHMINPFHHKANKKRIMDHIGALYYLISEIKTNIEDLNNGYSNFIKAVNSSKEREERLLNMNDLKTGDFINKMERLKEHYDKFKYTATESIENNKNEFHQSLKSKMKELFPNSIAELRGITKYIKYINVTTMNLNKIITSIFSKTMRLCDVYEENINYIYEVGKEYYKDQLNKLSNSLIHEYSEYNKALNIFSNEKYINNFSDTFYLELLKKKLNDSKDKIVMMDVSSVLEQHTFYDVSHFFNTFLKNYNKGFIIYVINRINVNYYNNKIILIESQKLLKLIKFIKKNYNHIKIDYIVIHIFNMYISVFINSNHILYHVNFDFFYDGQLVNVYNTYNYGYFFTNQKIDYEEFNQNGDYIYVFYVGNRVVNDNFFIHNRHDMIEFKKLSSYNIIKNNKYNNAYPFFNIYLLKLESEYSFLNQFYSQEHKYLYKFSVHNTNVVLTYNLLSNFTIPNEKFTPHFKEVYIIIILYPGQNIDNICCEFSGYIFNDGIYILRKEDANVLEIYTSDDKLTLLVNNQTKSYSINQQKKKKKKNLEDSLLRIKECLKNYINNYYSDYFDYLNIIFFISSD
ncbi:conserved Plasmodium protein, unknown function [Plasmodium chabaudi chabaudi]|uniref:Reticulocyte binding protein n=1 Tax=Plasmodium chabaudi chabaudi TaxID=31271 RepID=A0A4V0KE92_PLACU|nr:conserved Plasmodium protein, unknown function [Plasmodium chabaudi chabaudi]VTZ71208.1 conserved Plasmodium protein, unknown function [Plasmodium chabaudi chabaudi]|eukprot:XP_016655040.1 conserved Plasmodium protein, unknown function [Plasmodium chabaudi chabaudi]